jgi:hypothetical protein
VASSRVNLTFTLPLLSDGTVDSSHEQEQIMSSIEGTETHARAVGSA